MKPPRLASPTRSLALALAACALFAPSLALAQDAGDATAEVTAPAEATLIIVVPVTEAPAAEVPTAEPPVAQPIVVDDAELAPPAPFEPGPFSIGISGMVGTRDDGRGGLTPTWTGGLDVSLRLMSWLAIAGRRLHFSSADTLHGNRYAIGISPAVELMLRPWERIELFGTLGAGLQTRFGADQELRMGVAPFIGAGARFFAADIFSIGLEGAVYVPSTDGYLFGHEIMPAGAVLFTGGLSLAFHIG